MICHFNAFGNGPLTDYGRALGANAITGKLFTNATDEELGARAGFLGTTQLPFWLRPQLGYRGLYYVPALGKSGSPRWIHMSADASVVLKVLNDKLFAVGTVGYAPTPRGYTSSQVSHAISREHYVGVQISKGLRFQAGMTDIVFGVRIPDHNAFSRTKTLLAQNDQTHGISAHWGSRFFELGVHAFAGNLFQQKTKRLKGAATLFEFDAAEKLRLGASLLVSQNSYRKHNVAALHLRMAAGEGSSILTELGWLQDGALSASVQSGSYAFFQSMSRLGRGVHFLATGEYYSQVTFAPSTRIFRVGPGLQYFPMNRVEMRFDLLGTRTLGDGRAQSDTFDGLAQIHLWF